VDRAQLRRLAQDLSVVVARVQRDVRVRVDEAGHAREAAEVEDGRAWGNGEARSYVHDRPAPHDHGDTLARRTCGAVEQPATSDVGHGFVGRHGSARQGQHPRQDGERALHGAKPTSSGARTEGRDARHGTPHAV